MEIVMCHLKDDMHLVIMEIDAFEYFKIHRYVTLLLILKG